MFGPNREKVIRIVSILVLAIFIFGIVASVMITFLPVIIILAVVGVVIYLLKSGKRKNKTNR